MIKQIEGKGQPVVGWLVLGRPDGQRRADASTALLTVTASLLRGLLPIARPGLLHRLQGRATAAQDQPSSQRQRCWKEGIRTLTSEAGPLPHTSSNVRRSSLRCSRYGVMTPTAEKGWVRVGRQMGSGRGTGAWAWGAGPGGSGPVRTPNRGWQSIWQRENQAAKRPAGDQRGAKRYGVMTPTAGGGGVGVGGWVRDERWVVGSGWVGGRVEGELWDGDRHEGSRCGARAGQRQPTQ